MDLQLKQKRVWVQGSSGGLGLAIARAFVNEGARVAICSRSAERIEAAKREIGAELAVPCDLNKAGEPTRVAREIESKWGGIDVLVVNTGGPPKGPFMELTAAQWQSGFESLWLSAVESIQAVFPKMKAQGFGRILLVTSAAAKEPMAGLNVSNGLRAGLMGLTKSVSNEVAEFGITVNALLPGYTDTERLRELQIPAEKITAMIPARRLGRPEELAALAAFLSSTSAGYITGQMIACDGGWMRGH